MKQTVLCASLLLLAACASDRSVEAHIATTGESFAGTFDPGTFSGSLEMESTGGVKCTGRSTGSETIGTTVVVLICDDGRTGSAAVSALMASVDAGASYGLMVERVNQHYPFYFRGRSDDTKVYDQYRALAD